MIRFFRFVALGLLLLSVIGCDAPEQSAQLVKESQLMVRMTTSLGVIELELDAVKAPKTVKNFVEYANSGHYDETIFHRVIPGFMIQGGGMGPGMKEKATGRPVENEADNGLKNLIGTNNNRKKLNSFCDNRQNCLQNRCYSKLNNEL